MKNINAGLKIITLIVIWVSITSQQNVYAEKYIYITDGAGTYKSADRCDIGHQDMIRWPSTSISWYINSDACHDDIENFSDTQTAVDNAFETWEDVSTANISFTYAGSTANTQSNNDGKNVLYWETEQDELVGAYALTIITINSSNEITDVDIVFNGHEYYWSDWGHTPPGSSEADIQGVATHEIGHLCGLHHTTTSGSGNSDHPTMVAPYLGAYARTLESDDEKGISFLYEGNIIENISLSGTNYFDWNVDINPNKTLTVNSNATLRFAASKELEVNGTLSVASGATFTKLSGGSNWSGIDIESWGELDTTGDITIEYATTGIDIYDTNGLSNGSNEITIDNCSSAGIHVHHCDPEIEEVSISNVSAGYGGILIEGSTSDAILHDITVTSCVKGIQLGSYADADVYLCDIRSITYQCIYMGTAAHIYMDDDGGYGHNTIDPASGQKAIYNTSTNGSIDAENNYWGDTPSDSYFGYAAYVDYDPYLGSAYSGVGAGKAVPNIVLNPFTEAYQYERTGNWSLATEKYREIIAETSDNQEKRRSIKSLIRVQDKSDKNYDFIRNIISNELDDATTKGYYRAVLDNILCELNVREGNINKAIEMFSEKAEMYHGTSMEVEMLARISELYGNEMGNKQKAKEYADLAASVNPGQLSLYSAYAAANIEYEPTDFIDRYAGKIENFDIQPKPIDEPVTEETQQFVSISPNPANPNTTITYSITEPSIVKLKIYSITGQKIATLVDGYMHAGVHSAAFNGSNLASGIYLYNFESKRFKKSGKMLMVK